MLRMSLICTALVLTIGSMRHPRSDSELGQQSRLHTCRFTLVNGQWQGTCTPAPEDLVRVTMSRANAITTGAWKKGVDPDEVWAGKMVYTDDAEKIEIETYPEGTGVLRTGSGWFPVSNFQSSASSVQFQFDTAKEVPPSDLDRQIIERASAILSSDAVWNRADNRKCSPTDTRWSIYCAMEKATIDVTGAFHHRRPALQVVRQIVDERTAGRNYHHRLMDYNNDPSTHLDDVRSLFAEALKRIHP